MAVSVMQRDGQRGRRAAPEGRTASAGALRVGRGHVPVQPVVPRADPAAASRFPATCRHLRARISLPPPRPGGCPLSAHGKARRTGVVPRASVTPANRGLTPSTEWARQDLNLLPIDYESTALTAELRARAAGK